MKKSVAVARRRYIRTFRRPEITLREDQYIAGWFTNEIFYTVYRKTFDKIIKMKRSSAS